MRLQVVVIGGTGATGRELVRQLLAHPQVETVSVLVRRPYFEAHPKLIEVQVDFDRLIDYSAHIKGDIAYSTLGTTIKDAGSKTEQWRIDHDIPLTFAAIAKEHGIPSFVLLSAAGADTDSRIYYSQMKGQLEKDIIALEFPNLSILQPGIIDRPGTERRGEKIALKTIRFINAMGALKGLAPIRTADLAKAMVDVSIPMLKSGKQVYTSKQLLRGVLNA